jgi:hypothetical protein
VHTSAAAQTGGGEESIKNGPGPKTGAARKLPHVLRLIGLLSAQNLIQATLKNY